MKTSLVKPDLERCNDFFAKCYLHEFESTEEKKLFFDLARIQIFNKIFMYDDISLERIQELKAVWREVEKAYKNYSFEECSEGTNGDTDIND